MKVSLNIVRQFIDFELPPIDDLVHVINTQLGGVEEVIDFRGKYRGIKIVKIISAVKHPDADRLQVCKIDDGGAIGGLDRDENGYVQVVCGAPNAQAGIFAVWLSPGLTVPSSYATKEPFVLEKRAIRGEVSNGMLAALDELDLGEDHAGIIEINPEEQLPNGEKIVVGSDFAKVYGLDDYVIDIENKMFTHRPDLFGQLGVAREIAGVLGQQFKSPDWYNVLPTFASAEGLALRVENNIDAVPRFMAVALKDISIAPSPLWLSIALNQLGSKSINNIVDITNYVMHITAQPLHAYDYDKVGTGVVGVRYAVQDEEIALLNGKAIKLNEKDIVITDGQKPIGLGGVMGGIETEVSNQTKNIILECANFDMYTIRRTSMRHGLFTDAVTRFNKGQSALQIPRVLQYASNLVQQLSGGVQASDAMQSVDCGSVWVADDGWNGDEQLITPARINAVLGSAFKQEDILKLLSNVEFGNDVEGENIKLYSPFWRTDIEITEDIIEEVGRLYGFNNLPKALPARIIAAPQIDKKITLKKHIRNMLAKLGANELLTYNFVHGDMLDKVGQSRSDSYMLRNAISPELQYYRQSLTPSLLEKVHPNIKAGYPEVALFEIGKSHIKDLKADDGLPHESERLAFVLAVEDKHAEPLTGAAYYHAKYYLEKLLDSLNIQSVTYRPIDLDGRDTNKIYFAEGRSATIYSGDMLIGRIGEYKPSVVKAFKLPDFAVGFELGIQPLTDLVSDSSRYTPLSKFPKTCQDITLEEPAEKPYAEIEEYVKAKLVLSGYDWNIAPVTIYKPRESVTKKVTFRILLSRTDRTLTQQEVNDLMSSIQG